jgi:hypothetical protein
MASVVVIAGVEKMMEAKMGKARVVGEVQAETGEVSVGVKVVAAKVVEMAANWAAWGFAAAGLEGKTAEGRVGACLLRVECHSATHHGWGGGKGSQGRRRLFPPALVLG